MPFKVPKGIFKWHFEQENEKTIVMEGQYEDCNEALLRIVPRIRGSIQAAGKQNTFIDLGEVILYLNIFSDR